MSEDANSSTASTNVPAHSGHAMSGIKPPDPPVFDSNIASSWKLFKQMWSDYEVLSELDNKPPKFRVALLRRSLGVDGLRIYNGFQFDMKEDELTFEQILERLDAYAVGETNEIYERYVFRQRDQKEGETFENFLANI